MRKTALDNLTAQYTDSENESINTPDTTKISKDEDLRTVSQSSGRDHQHHYHHHHHHRHQHDYRQSSSSKGIEREPSEPVDVEIADYMEPSKKPKTSRKALRRKLVSYIEDIMHSGDDNDYDGKDDDDSDDGDDDHDDEDLEYISKDNASDRSFRDSNIVDRNKKNYQLAKEKVQQSSRKTESKQADLEMEKKGDLKYAKYAHYGFSLPPEPKGKQPSPELVEKIHHLYEKMATQGMDMNEVIQRRKEFRNPSIYEKLIQFCDINELGTNYPPEIYDPLRWGPESYYDELDRVQIKEMEKRRKERKDKDKIEQVSALARKVEEEAKRRKSKWDQPAPSLKQGYQGQTLTTTVTGTKGTVISAFGSLPKKLHLQ